MRQANRAKADERYPNGSLCGNPVFDEDPRREPTPGCRAGRFGASDRRDVPLGRYTAQSLTGVPGKTRSAQAKIMTLGPDFNTLGCMRWRRRRSNPSFKLFFSCVMTELVFTRVDAALMLLDRHRVRRRQQIPALSVVVGDRGAPARLVHRWARLADVHVCESTNVALAEQVSDWFAALVRVRELAGPGVHLAGPTRRRQRRGALAPVMSSFCTRT